MSDNKEPSVYDLLADHLGLKETYIANQWKGQYNDYYILTKYGFRRILPGLPILNPREVLDILETFSAELEANGTLTKNISKWFTNELRRRNK